jgi:iron complex transport system substrate-binding protein
VLVLIMPCSFDLARTIHDAKPLARLPEWQYLPAVQKTRVYAVDGGRYFSRHGPRIVDGVAVLGEILHPELFPRRSPDSAWRRLS